MWIFLNNAFVSIVAHYDDPSVYLVRARIKGDIQRAFPSVEDDEVEFETGTDYAYRATVNREVAQVAIMQHMEQIDYGNFKNSMAKKDKKRKTAYMGVWSEMYAYQQRTNPIEVDDWVNYREYR